jgi:DNA-binding transcriptional MerR regulator
MLMLEPSHNALLPAIPSKRYFSIGEVGELCNVKPHVLRYWEQEFEQLSPMKRRGNRRYYQHEEVLMIRQIRSLLYEQGYTISGARVQLQSESKRTTTAAPLAVTPEASAETVPSTDALLAYQLKISQNMLNVVIKDMIRELESVLNVLGKNAQVRGI